MTIQFPLLSARVYVRPFRTSDSPAIHRVYGDPEVMRYVAHGKPAESLAESAEMVASYIEQQHAHGYSPWLLAERSTHEVIGDIGFAARPGSAEFGYTLARSRWGQGLATEAGRLCIAAAFEELAFPMLSALVDPQNPASSRVLS
ncbi:MAG: GNAT family N-acetyltransferase, partial [Stackebrandtia sp.]